MLLAPLLRRVLPRRGEGRWFRLEVDGPAERDAVQAALARRLPEFTLVRYQPHGAVSGVETTVDHPEGQVMDWTPLQSTPDATQWLVATGTGLRPAPSAQELRRAAAAGFTAPVRVWEISRFDYRHGVRGGIIDKPRLVDRPLL